MNVGYWSKSISGKYFIFYEMILKLYFMKCPERKIGQCILPFKKGCVKEECILLAYDHMSAVVETSFFHPKNVGFLNSKLWWAADANQITNWLRPRLIYWKITHFGHCNYVVLSWGGLIFTPSSFQIFIYFITGRMTTWI